MTSLPWPHRAASYVLPLLTKFKVKGMGATVVLLTPVNSLGCVYQLSHRHNIPSYSARVYVVPVPLTATNVLFFRVLPSLTPRTLLSMVKVAHSTT